MSEFPILLRSATAEDEKAIQELIKRAQLDPSNLHWENFLLAEYEGEIVGMGQIKPYPDCRELGSLYTKREFRGKEIASRIIEGLEAKSSFPLYLLCQEKMEAYYQRFAYQRISWWDAPNSLKIKLMFSWLFRIWGIKVLVMRKD